MNPETIFILKWAQTKDGFLDHDGKNRLIISSMEDRAAVLKLRSECSMILVGANTVRRDNPSLKLTNPTTKKTLIRAVLSSDGNLSADFKIFDKNDGVRRILFLLDKSTAIKKFKDTGVEIVEISKKCPASDIKKWCRDENFNKVLVEGGKQVHTQFIKEKAYDFIRVATGDTVIGSHGTIKAFDLPTVLPFLAELEEERYGRTLVTWYKRKD